MEKLDIRESNPNLDFKKMEDYILSLTPSLIKLEGFVADSNFEQGLFEIILNSNRHRSITVDNNLYCRPYNRRSITDIFKLCKFYYPEITLVEVYNTLMALCTTKLKTWICKEVGKRVWMYTGSGSPGFISAKIDEYGVTFPQEIPERYSGYGDDYGTRELNFVKIDLKINK